MQDHYNLLAREEERERCAKIADAVYARSMEGMKDLAPYERDHRVASTAKKIAAAIRAGEEG